MKWKNNPKGISNYRVIQAIEWLESEGYVLNTVSSAFQLLMDEKKMSYVVPTYKFLKKFSTSDVVEDAKQARLEASPVLVLRKDKVIVDYGNSQEAVAYEEAMRLMNRSNAMFDVKDVDQNSLETLYARMFNESFDFNGRMYCASVTNMENRESSGRLKIQVNAQPINEVDFAALHINILADLHNLPLAHGDTYLNMLPEGMKTPSNRNVIKLCVNTMLNSKSKRSALLAFRTPLDETEGHTFSSPSEVLQCIYNSIGKLQEHLYTEKLGLRITKIESDIMTDVVQSLVAMKRPVFPIHDSALVVAEDKELLADTMAAMYRKHMKVNRVVGMRCSKYDGSVIKEDCSR